MKNNLRIIGLVWLVVIGACLIYSNTSFTRVVREGNSEEEVCYVGCDTYGFDVPFDEKTLLSWKSGWRRCILLIKQFI